MKASKERVLYQIEVATGLDLERVNSAGAKGGTSTTGAQGRRFFSEECVAVISHLCTDQNREMVLLAHKQLSVILRIISSTQKIKVDLFEKLCKEFIADLAMNFPWAQINHTLHGSVQHSVELIKLNGNTALGAYSEEAIEATNKDVRNFLRDLSRKCDPLLQMEDVMARLLERSHPTVIQHINRANYSRMKCTVCGSTDHTVRSHRNGQPINNLYDSMVSALFDR